MQVQAPKVQAFQCEDASSGSAMAQNAAPEEAAAKNKNVSSCGVGESGPQPEARDLPPPVRAEPEQKPNAVASAPQPADRPEAELPHDASGNGAKTALQPDSYPKEKPEPNLDPEAEVISCNASSVGADTAAQPDSYCEEKPEPNLEAVASIPGDASIVLDNNAAADAMHGDTDEEDFARDQAP